MQFTTCRPTTRRGIPSPGRCRPGRPASPTAALPLLPALASYTGGHAERTRRVLRNAFKCSAGECTSGNPADRLSGTHPISKCQKRPKVCSTARVCGSLRFSESRSSAKTIRHPDALSSCPKRPRPRVAGAVMSSFGTLFRVTTFGESHCAGRFPFPRVTRALLRLMSSAQRMPNGVGHRHVRRAAARRAPEACVARHYSARCYV